MLPFKSFSMGNAYPLKDGGYALAVGKTDISDDLCAQEWSADGHLLWTLELKRKGLNLVCYYLYKEEL